MVPSYLQMMRVQEVKNMAYIDLGIHDQRCEQAIGHMTAYVFDQLLPPTTWNGTWWGCTQVRCDDSSCSTKKRFLKKKGPAPPPPPKWEQDFIG